MVQRWSPRGLALVIGFGALQVSADESGSEAKPGNLGAITISAARLPSATFSEISSATSISEDTLDVHAVSSTADVLGIVPGLYVEQPGTRGSRSSLYLRGADPNATLVMIDGIKVNDPNSSLGGTYDLSLIDPSLIEQIEVVRGPGASIYGADALAGAINIRTKTGRPPAEARAALTAGSDGWLGAQGSYAYSSNGHAGMLQAAYRDDGEPVEGSEFVNRSLAWSHRAQLRPSSSMGLQVYANNNDSASFPEDSGGSRYAVLRELEQRTSQDLAANLSFEYAPSYRSEAKLALTYFNRDEDSESPGIAPGERDPFGLPASVSDSALKRVGLVATFLRRYAAGHQMIIGADLTSEEGDSDSTLDFGGFPVDSSFALERDTQALFFYGRRRVSERLTGELGLRADHVENDDTELNPSASAQWAITSDTALRVNWGQGFKLPSFYALGNPLVGNPDLVPETSDMIDGGIVVERLGVLERIEFTLFRNAFENLVDFDAGPPPRLVNRDEVVTRGAEIFATGALNSSLSFTGQATYTEHEIVGSDDVLFNRPEWVGSAALSYSLQPATTVAVRVRYTGTRYDSSVPTGTVKLDPYFRVDANVNHQFSAAIKAVLGIDNLLDEDYEEAVGFEAPGWRAYLTLAVQW